VSRERKAIAMALRQSIEMEIVKHVLYVRYGLRRAA
jgi:hypothetical protein